MTLKVRTATSQKEVTRVRVRQNPGVHLVSQIRVRTAGGLKSVFFTGGGDGTITAGMDPTFVNGVRTSNTPIVVTSNSATASGTKGTAPYTYAWSAGTNIEAIYPTSPTTAFRSISAMSPNTTDEETFTCTVTDADGRTEVSPTLTVRVVLRSYL